MGTGRGHRTRWFAVLVGCSLALACGREGYLGEADPCDAITCAGHGTCVALGQEPMCICEQGYYADGLECKELTVDNPCVGVTCSGFGTCAVRNGQALCVCAPGYHNPPEDPANCVADQHPCDGEDGDPCDDGEFCTVDDTCFDGICTGVANTCDDGNSCTVDLCNEIDDECINTSKADDTPCDDGAYCTVGERCQASACVGGQARVCSDGNPCTEDTCDDDLDACVNTQLADGSECQDGAYCTVDDVCQAGVCIGGANRDCTDGNDCTSDVCNEATDQCENPPLVDGTPCEDGQYCTVADVCSGGDCQGGGARDCSDGDQCSSDACDDDLDMCVHAAVPDGTVCSDGRFCTLGEVCTGGSCTGGAARDCTDGNPCTVDVCDDGAATCTHADEPDGTSCDDGLWCTLDSSCQAGICAGGSFRDCSDGNGCTLDSCDDVADACVNDAGAMDGAGCDDGEFCTVADSCTAGACSGSLNPCDDGNPCTADSCDAVGGQCVHTPVADGAGCDDGLFCTVGDACNAGVCSGTARDCNDGSVCTADSCNEVDDACVNLAVADGTVCDDGAWCNVGETCVGGVCGGGIPRNCSDGNQCTTDGCDEANDACTNTNVADGTGCDDGLYCTLGETCTGGACGGGAARNCGDGNACTQDVCNEMSDSCEHPAVAEGTPCDDGQFCTLGDACSGGTCVGPTGRDCSDGNACTNDVCDEVGDSCVSTPVVDGTSCNDGNFCTLGETCAGGTCGGGVARSCADGNACTADTCDEGSDACVNTPVANGTACDDGAYCTQGETCNAGVCGNSTARNCADGNPCTLDFCDEASDACVNDAGAMDGTSCDDGQFCTTDDACLAGACTGGGVRTCNDGNVCTADSCDEGANVCVNDAAAANGTACNDGAFCTVNDACSGGACVGGAARDCSDGNDCTLDSCDEIGDACVNNAAAANGNACDDGLYCNVGETCAGGVCSGGGPRACADANQCTVDSCDEAGDTCVHNAPAANGNACDDGLFCNVGETCLAGACQGGGANGCSDGNACTVDSCNEAGDVCVNDAGAADGNTCNDGSYCTVGEVCIGGTCGGGLARDCGDADPCTADTCNEVSDTCNHAAVSNGTACDDGAWCSLGETCTGGVCGGGVARSCSDGNDCTTDSCNDVTDTCVNTPVANGTVCDDGQYCIVGEVCTAGACGGGGPRNCSDGNACTLDSCDEAGDACLHDSGVLDGVACDDGNFCLVGETCTGGACTGGTVRPCDDGNSCTDNNCNEGADVCDNPPKANGSSCQDGLFCTSPDSCSGGVCQPGASTPCAADPCAAVCDEGADACSGCTPAGTYCVNAAQEATCDGACNLTELTICSYGCNAGRDECNQCTPSAVECKGDAELLCNAEFVCDVTGLILSKTCCTSDQCSCDGDMCLEDLCAMAPDVSGGGSFPGDTCNDRDNIPGDCNPGGPACRSVGSGGAPEEMFQFTLATFATVELDTSGSALDTTLRTSKVCGSEARQIPYADVCGPPGTVPLQACSEQAGPEVMRLCGLPAGTYYGAVDSALGTCGTYSMDVTVTPVTLDDAPQAGNISLGGTFTGNTCALADDFAFPDTTLWSGSSCADCTPNGSDTDCPDCRVGAATDCTLAPNSNDDKCTYSGTGSPDAVFYLALKVDSGVDISTQGSDFDTVLYIMETGAGGATPPGEKRVCNDDCWIPDGPSHIQTSLAAGLYYVFVDGAGGACGNYQLNVTISPAANCPNLSCDVPYENCENCTLDCPCPGCGDGALDTAGGEECDDGDNDDGDGCNASCVIEPGWGCHGEPSVCNDVPFNVDQTSNCACTIPDGGSRVDTIDVVTPCMITDINIDMNIGHPYRGDISLMLTSPDGTTVRLKQEDGGDSSNNIVGNYPGTLTVDGPGQLSDFFGGPGDGTWTLMATDHWTPDQGTLNSWSLHLTCL